MNILRGPGYFLQYSYSLCEKNVTHITQVGVWKVKVKIGGKYKGEK